MFRIQLPNQRIFQVDFDHFNPENPRTPVMDQYGTVCSITEVNGSGEAMGSPLVGSSVLHKLDFTAYNKEKGRKISLARALGTFEDQEDIPFTRDQRALFWDKYFARKKADQDRNFDQRLDKVIDEVKEKYL